MAEKDRQQLSLCDSVLAKKDQLNTTLDRIQAYVDWERFHRILKPLHDSAVGRKAYPSISLFKCLLLQKWYDISDYELEAALDDRLSFRRFAGFSLDNEVPDHSTFSRFRTMLIKYDLKEKVFEELAMQMEIKGLILKRGTLVDASLVEAAVAKPDQKEDGRAGKSEVDPEAEWVKKGRKTLFGYKIHVGVDEGTGIIRKAEMTLANVYDGHKLIEMVNRDEGIVYADKAYDTKGNVSFLGKNGIINGILRKGYRGHPLTKEDRARNKPLGKIRSGIERIFGTLKRSYRYRRTRYIGLLKNGLEFLLLCMAYNMKKISVLSKN